jgi:hypothetical protein
MRGNHLPSRHRRQSAQADFVSALRHSLCPAGASSLPTDASNPPTRRLSHSRTPALSHCRGVAVS